MSKEAEETSPVASESASKETTKETEKSKKTLWDWAKEYWYIVLVIIAAAGFAIWYYCLRYNPEAAGELPMAAPSLPVATDSGPALKIHRVRK